jgi:hypothetical protein
VSLSLHFVSSAGKITGGLVELLSKKALIKNNQKSRCTDAGGF